MFELIAAIPLIISSAIEAPLPEGNPQVISYIQNTQPTVFEQHINEKILASTDETIQLAVPFVHQLDDLNEANMNTAQGTACGPTTLTIVFKYNELDIDLNNVIDSLPSEVYVKGVGFYNLQKGSTYFGMNSVEVEQSPTGIYNALKEGNPVILNIQNYDGLYGHAVVVTGIKGYDGVNAKYLVVHDPFKAPYREFEYINNNTLKQPEGFINPIGTHKPFYITK